MKNPESESTRRGRIKNLSRVNLETKKMETDQEFMDLYNELHRLDERGQLPNVVREIMKLTGLNPEQSFASLPGEPQSWIVDIYLAKRKLRQPLVQIIQERWPHLYHDPANPKKRRR